MEFYGVAIGTLVPSVFVNLIFWATIHLSSRRPELFEVVWKVWAPMFLASIPFIVATYAVNAFWPAHNLPVFFLQVICTLSVFVATIGLMYRTYVRSQILPKIRSLFFAETNGLGTLAMRSEALCFAHFKPVDAVAGSRSARLGL